MKATKTKILNEANKIYDFISRETLSSADKKWAIAETVKGFKDYINPGFLEYRK